MPAHSLQRSQYVNGLAELTPEIRRPLFESTADLVSQHYRGSDATSGPFERPFPVASSEVGCPGSPTTSMRATISTTRRAIARRRCF